jgi:hypothetical protein
MDLTSLGWFFDSLNNCRFWVFEKKSEPKGPPVPGYLKKIQIQRTTGSGYLKKNQNPKTPVLVISKTSTNHRVS